MATATFIKDIECKGLNAVTAKHWRIDCRAGAHYVRTSATIVLGEPECYVFGADKDGKVTDWRERPGSMKEALDHQGAIDDYIDAIEDGYDPEED